MTKFISSIQNPLVKNILLLKDKSKARKKQGLFVLEGIRELILAINANYNITQLLFYKELIALDTIRKIATDTNITFIEISKDVFQKLALRSTTEGIIALVKTKDFNLNGIDLKSNPLILVAEAPEKPGNIGALLRTADAANVDAVIIANPKTDLFNANIIRSSVGCIFTNTIGIGSTPEIISFLKEHNVRLYAAALRDDSEVYIAQDFTKATAIIVGTEATGLSEIWMQEAKKIIIPMQGEIDSLNVSVSAAILIFEAKRQRKFL